MGVDKERDVRPVLEPEEEGGEPTVTPKLATRNPKLETRNPKLETRNPRPENRNPKPETQNPVNERERVRESERVCELVSERE